MNKSIVTLTTALAIAAAGGLAYAQADNSGSSNGVPGVEANVGANAKNDGGLPGVEMNIGADGDQKNVDTSTLGAGPATTDTGSSDLTQPQVDRN